MQASGRHSSFLSSFLGPSGNSTLVRITCIIRVSIRCTMNPFKRGTAAVGDRGAKRRAVHSSRAIRLQYEYRTSHLRVPTYRHTKYDDTIGGIPLPGSDQGSDQRIKVGSRREATNTNTHGTLFETSMHRAIHSKTISLRNHYDTSRRDRITPRENTPRTARVRQLSGSDITHERRGRPGAGRAGHEVYRNEETGVSSRCTTPEPEKYMLKSLRLPLMEIDRRSATKLSKHRIGVPSFVIDNRIHTPRLHRPTSANFYQATKRPFVCLNIVLEGRTHLQTNIRKASSTDTFVTQLSHGECFCRIRSAALPRYYILSPSVGPSISKLWP